MGNKGLVNSGHGKRSQRTPVHGPEAYLLLMLRQFYTALTSKPNSSRVALRKVREGASYLLEFFRLVV